jgi:hypothetical protein
MTALAADTTATACAVADTHGADEVFHVEHRGGHTGQRVELARYTVAGGDERVLYGQRVDGVVRVTDVAAHGHGRAYLVERGLEQDGYSALKALVADYLEQAGVLAAVPMAVCPLESEAGEEAER